MPGRTAKHRPQQQSFSFIVADDDGHFVEYAAIVSPDIVQHIGTVLAEVARCQDVRRRRAAAVKVEPATLHLIRSKKPA